VHIVRPAKTPLAFFTAFALLGAVGTSDRLTYPPTKTVPVTDTYFGTVVADPYRWLEDGTDPTVKAWAAAQTKLALDFIDGTPSYAGYKARIAELSRTSTARFGLAISGNRLILSSATV
jgi:prolyl oligopeptidase